MHIADDKFWKHTADSVAPSEKRIDTDRIWLRPKLKLGIALTPLLLTALVGFFLFAPMEMWRNPGSGVRSSQPPVVDRSLSREQYIAVKVRAWRQFIKAKKRCDGFDDADRDLCLQQARQERAAATSVLQN